MGEKLEITSKVYLSLFPSVGYGSVLRDLIDGGLPCTKLEKTFRQASESGLFANIEHIKSGLHSGFEKRDDFDVLEAKTTSEAKDIMVKSFLEAADKYGLDNVVCLTPYRRKGEACAIKLNSILQALINPPKNGSPASKEKALDILNQLISPTLSQFSTTY